MLAASGEVVAEVSGSKRAVADAVLDRVVELLRHDQPPSSR